MARKVDTGGETIAEEVKEHAQLWNRSPKFRRAVEARTKSTPAPKRKATGKR